VSDEKQKRVYESEVLGLPPLKMTLTNAENERANRTRRPLPKKQPHSKEFKERMETIIRLIESLESE
jgi:hypothetical protein